MYYANIKPLDIADGEGVRVTLFVSGCRNHCEGCFQPETWCFTYGQPYTDQTEQQLIDALRPDYVDGLTLLGGEPFEPENQRVLVGLIDRVRKTYPKKTIWAYSGYVYDRDLLPGGRAFCEVTDEILDSLAVLVDGPFIERLKDISLKFRGSSNQRLIDMTATRRTGSVVPLP